MRTPLGSTRPLLAYGLPAAAGLAVGGALAGQGVVLVLLALPDVMPRLLARLCRKPLNVLTE